MKRLSPDKQFTGQLLRDKNFTSNLDQNTYELIGSLNLLTNSPVMYQTFH